MSEQPHPVNLTTIDVEAVQDHEMFASWVRAGFSEVQAMQLLVAVKREMIRALFSGREDNSE